MPDLDQGGTDRQTVEVLQGPSVGRTRTPYRNLLVITAAGTYQIDYSTTLIHINTTGAVTIQLPAASNPNAPAVTQSVPYAKVPIGIVDISGNPNVTITPAAGETILNQSFLLLHTAYAGFILYPSNIFHGWTNQS